MSQSRKFFHNQPPGDVPTDAPSDAVRAEFANRLQKAMVDKGWNQSELARRASDHLKEGKVGRDSVSGYIRGVTLPTPPKLAALALALGVEASYLVPARGTQSATQKNPPLDVRAIDEDTVWLRINQAVEWPVALQIMNLLKGPKNDENKPQKEQSDGR